MAPKAAGLRHWRYLYLLIALVVLLLAYPYTGRGGPIGFAAVLLPIASVYALATRPGHRAVPIVLGAVTLYGMVQTGLGGGAIPLLAIVACALLLFGYTTIFVLWRVLRSERVTGDTLCGAIAVYLLIGLTWTLAYFMVELLHPGSFRVAGGSRILNGKDLYYLSYVTLATIGYGDVLPATDWARSLAILEGLCGTIYLAILVARLIGLHLAHSASSR